VYVLNGSYGCFGVDELEIGLLRQVEVENHYFGNVLMLTLVFIVFLRTFAYYFIVRSVAYF